MFCRRFFPDRFYARRYFVSHATHGPLPTPLPPFTETGVTVTTLLDEIVTRTRIINEDVSHEQ